MKNPNGYGTVVKLSGNRRNPYAVRKTAGFDERGYPIYLHIGYAPTKEEALIMLAEYNKAPWDIEMHKITFAQLYKMWMEKQMPRLGSSNAACLRAAYQHCRSLDRMKYCEIKAWHMQDCIDRCERGYATQAAIKNLFRHLDRYALEMDIISKCYSQLLISDSVPETKKQVFTDEEVTRIWDHQDLPWADSLIFFLYTGFRISEMINIQISDIDFDLWTITGGLKTEAGRHRLVPVHSKIQPIVLDRAKESQAGYLFETCGRPLTVSKYRTKWKALMTELQMEHTPHECRHTFRSRLDSAGANRVCIDRLMGHRSGNVGERVYTHKTIEELRYNLELITN